MLKDRTRKVDKLIKQIDHEYKGLLISIIKPIIKSSKARVTWEDIYYEFLCNFMDEVDSYDEEKAQFKTFIANKCKFFTKNKCRSLSSGNNRLWNETVPYDDGKLYAIKDYVYQQKTVELDIGLLNNFEFKVYEEVLVNGRNQVKTAERLNVSRYKVKKALEKIKEKYEKQLKNFI